MQQYPYPLHLPFYLASMQPRPNRRPLIILPALLPDPARDHPPAAG